MTSSAHNAPSVLRERPLLENVRVAQVMERGPSGRLLLRRVESGDRKEILAMYEAGRELESWSPALEAGKTLDQIFDQWLEADPSRHVRLVAERLDGRESPRLSNVVAYTEIVRGVFQNAFIGWRTHPALTGRGYGTEAVRLAIQYAFDRGGLGLHRIQAGIELWNVASLRIAEKCGFRREGVAQRYLRIGGEWRDCEIFALTVEEARSPELFTGPVDPTN